MIKEIGKSKWKGFKVGNPVRKGTECQYEIIADQKKAMLCFSFNKAGTTTIMAKGSNVAISQEVLRGLQKKCLSPQSQKSESYSFKNISKKRAKGLIKHLNSITRKAPQVKSSTNNPSYTSYAFVGNTGDKLRVTHYTNGVVALQGKPVELYNEALSYLSASTQVTQKQIIESTNTFHKTDLSQYDVQETLKTFLPNCYDILDETILKLLSPSICLKSLDVLVPDYSYHTFPALRALEGYIKLALSNKGIEVKAMFAEVFNQGSLKSTVLQKTIDKAYASQIERLYDYYRHVRHAIFHANQNPKDTKIITTREEADIIVNQVLSLIDSTSKILCA